MGLVETARTAAAVAFKAVGNIAISGSYRSVQGRTYDPESGHMVGGHDSLKTTDTAVAVTIIRSTYEREFKQVAGSQEPVRNTTAVALIQVAELSAAGITPRQGDEIDMSGETYHVTDFTQDPAGAVWTIVLDRP